LTSTKEQSFSRQAAIEAENQLDAVLAKAAGQAQRQGDLARLVGAQAGEWVNVEDVDLLGRFCATSSISTPPSAEAIRQYRLVTRSRVIER